MSCLLPPVHPPKWKSRAQHTMGTQKQTQHTKTKQNEKKFPPCCVILTCAEGPPSPPPPFGVIRFDPHLLHLCFRECLYIGMLHYESTLDSDVVDADLFSFCFKCLFSDYRTYKIFIINSRYGHSKNNGKSRQNWSDIFFLISTKLDDLLDLCFIWTKLCDLSSLFQRIFIADVIKTINTTSPSTEPARKPQNYGKYQWFRTYILYKPCLFVLWVSQVKILNQNLVLILLEET